MIPHYGIVSFFTISLVFFSSGCQDQWTLDSVNLLLNDGVGYQNFTKLGDREFLHFDWTENNSKQYWRMKISRYFRFGIIDGLLYYKNYRTNEDTFVNWRIDRNEFTYVSSEMKVFNASWRIAICNGLALEFMSREDGSWKFSIDSHVIKGGQIPLIYNPATSRKKRSPEETEEDEAPQPGTGGTNSTGPNFFDRIYDFFFAEGDPVMGRSEGVFTRVKNWMKSVICNIKEFCEDNPKEPFDSESFENLSDKRDEATGRSDGVFTHVKNWMKRVVCDIKQNCEDNPAEPSVTIPTVDPEYIEKLPVDENGAYMDNIP